jgi:hypothetical protein
VSEQEPQKSYKLDPAAQKYCKEWHMHVTSNVKYHHAARRDGWKQTEKSMNLPSFKLRGILETHGCNIDVA